jgi:hypothetical protein
VTPAKGLAEQAMVIIDTLDRDYTKLDRTWTSRDEAIRYITHALAQREAEVWEEAAKLVLSFGSHSSNPNDPSAPWVCSPIYEQCKGLAKAIRHHAQPPTPGRSER